MMRRTRLLALAACLAATTAACDRGCSGATSSAPAIPASSHPLGDDLVKGGVVIASEADGGYRVLKIVHVDDYPDPIGWEMHMIAYDPKVASIAEGAKLWGSGRDTMKIVIDHMLVRRVHFMKREYRVIGVEAVTPAEAKPYLDAVRNH